MPTQNHPLLRFTLLAALLATASPALAEPPNVIETPLGQPGPAARLVLAQRTYDTAMRQGDAVALLAAIRLARGVTRRLPTGWTRTTLGEALADQPAGRNGPPDPAAPETLAILQSLAAEDPSLQDLVYDLDAQLPHDRRATVSEASADLDGGQSDSWRLALSGLVPAELGLIGDGDSPLGLTITDASGAIICSRPPGTDPALCRFTPARNGFFTVTVANVGSTRNTYDLIGS